MEAAVVILIVGCMGFGNQVATSDSALPDVPTWEDDVQPIVGVVCGECHTDPSQNGAPDSFRLDVYADPDEPGAYEMRDQVISLAVDFVPTQMPPTPREPLDESQRAVIVRWVETGAPETAGE